MIIEKITSDGIYYKDSEGKEGLINFNECNENWLVYRQRTEQLTDAQISSLRGWDRTVGQMEDDANPAFIEFFTRPFTKFEFNEMNEFNSMRDSVYSYGWTMVDLC
ncbi:hypothetical protein LJC34_08105 [Oscillospiraceae bacterium OttesenSCG-928-G22]|nr:hypothetical protein [Oscillospiraceae bacterium OttesenSCG-928-G22]